MFARVLNSNQRIGRGSVDLLEDVELQTWRNEMAYPMEDAGLGLEGIPNGKARVSPLCLLKISS